MATLHLRHEGACESLVPFSSQWVVWDIADRAPLVGRIAIETFHSDAIEQGISTAKFAGLSPMPVDFYVTAFRGRWNRLVLTEVLTPLAIEAFRTGPDGWYSSVCREVRKKGYSLEMAVETVVSAYLRARNPEPLFFLTKHEYVPSDGVGKRVAVMLKDRSDDFHIKVQPIRHKSGPQTLSSSEEAIQAVFGTGAELLTVGRDPGRRFWDYLCAAFYEDHRQAVQQKYQLQEPFSLKAFFKFSETSSKNAGRLLNLGLGVRDEVAADLFQDHVNKGEKVKKPREIAVEEFLTNWNADARAGQTLSKDTFNKKVRKKIPKPPPAAKLRRPARSVTKPARAQGKTTDWSTDECGYPTRYKTHD
jgi:hypothetical protein